MPSFGSDETTVDRLDSHSNGWNASGQQVLELPALPREESDEPLRERIGKWQVRRQVGKGGFGIVYAAWDAMLCKEVAIKVPKRSCMPHRQMLERFIRESRTAGALEHVNILAVFESGLDGDEPYMVMPLCAGPDLARWLREREDKTLPIDLALRWMIALTDAVDHAHKRGYIHRDLKPSNILLDQSSGSSDPHTWVPKLTDFGLAKALDDSAARRNAAYEPLTQNSDLLGTHEYMAPEQVACDHRNVGVATDVHGLGAVLFEMVYGASPYGGHDRTNSLMKVLNQAPQFPTTLIRRVPADLRAVIEKCLAKNPAERFQSAADLREELVRIQLGLPTKTRPLSVWGKAGRWMMRNPLGAAAAGLIITLATVLGYSIVQYEMEIRQQLDELRQERVQGVRKENERATILATSKVQRAMEFYSQGRTDLAFDYLNQIEVSGAFPFPEGLLRQQLWEREVVFFPGHHSRIDHLSLSADEHYAITHSVEDKVILSDLQTGARRSLLETEEMLMNGGNHASPTFLSSRKQLCYWDPHQPLKGLKRYPLRSLQQKTGVFVNASSRATVLNATDPSAGLIRYEVGENREVCIPWTPEMNPTPAQSYITWSSPSGDWMMLQGSNSKIYSWRADDPSTFFSIHLDGQLNNIGMSPILALAFDETQACCFIWQHGGTVTRIQGHPYRATQTLSPELAAIDFNPGQATEHRLCCFDPQQKSVLYTGNSRGRIISHDLATGKTDLLGELRGKTRFICHGEPGELFAANESMLISIDLRTRSIKQSWRIPVELLGSKIEDYFDLIQYVSSRRSLLLTGSDGRIALWNLKYQEPRIMWHREKSEVHAIAFSPDNRYLATGADNGDIHLWDPTTRQLLKTIFAHQEAVVMSLCFSADSKTLYSGSYDHTVKRWSVETGQHEMTYNGVPEDVRSIAVSARHQLLFAGYRKGHLLTWKLDDAKPCRQQKLHTDNIKSVALSPDEQTLYTGGEDSKICFVETATGVVRDSLNDQQQAWRLVPWGSYLFTSGAGAHLSIWDITQRKLAGVITDSSSSHNALAVTPDGEILVSGGEETNIRFWHLRSRQELGSLNTAHEKLFHLAISPDSKYLAASCKSGKVLVYPITPLMSSWKD